ncbi:MAG: glucosaminidase domain-containing protein [Thomasclavelia sp.]
MKEKCKRLFLTFLTLSMLFSTNLIGVNNIQAIDESDNLATNEDSDVKDDFEAGATLDKDQEVTAMDEDGNVLPLEDVEADMPSESEESDDKWDEMPKSRISNNSVAVVNFRTKSSSGVNTSYTEVNTGRPGYTNGYYAADGAFLGYDNESNPTKVKFMQAGVVGEVSVKDVEVLDYTSSKVVTTSKYYVSGGRLYHGIVSNLSNTSYSSRLDCGPAPSYLKEGKDYYSYDGHYFYENSTYASYSTMLNDYRNNVRTNAVNSSSPYYNYFQYLSHRSKTSYTAAQLNSAINAMVGSSESNNNRTSKLRNLGATFISEQDKYGSNALLMLAVAANESAWGCSNIAANKNNLFGHAAYDSDPNGSSNAYSSVEYSVYYHAAIFVSRGYLDPITDARYYGANLGDKASGMNVKYASDPYWGEKGASICWKIDNYLGNSDSKKYTIAIKDTINTNHSVINIKNNANSSATTLYSTYPVSSKTTYKSYAPSNYSFIIIGESGNYYKIQTDGAVNSGRTGIVVQSAYDYNNSYGYIPKSSVTVVKEGSYSDLGQNTSNTTGASSGKDSSEPHILYSANCQSVGWLETVTEPNTAGTTGRSLNLYQLKLSLSNVGKSVFLSGKVYSNGSWLTYDKINSSTQIGNSNKPMEVVNFNINNLAGYKLQYRVHSADLGWQSWVDQETNAGKTGYAIQAIDFRLVKDTSVVCKPSIYYRSHIEESGWLGYVGDSEIAGTTGESLGLEAFNIGIDNLSNYQLTVKTYDKTNGWKTYNSVSDSTIIGSTGKSLPLNAISATLTNDYGYIIEYQVHLSNKGWTSWTSQGTNCGDTKGTEQIEAIKFRVVESKVPTKISLNKTSLNLIVNKSETLTATIIPASVSTSLTWSTSNSKVATVDKNGKVTGVGTGTATITVTTSNGIKASCNVTVNKQKPSIQYQTHVADYGWLSFVSEGKTSGTTGENKQMEAIKIDLNTGSYKGSIEYSSHVQDYGWMSWIGNGKESGTTGKNKQMEAIKIRLTGDIAKEYNIYYRVHVEEMGWLDWASNGEAAGSTGYSYQIEAIEIKLVEKGETAPGTTTKPFEQRHYIKYAAHVADYGWLAEVYEGNISGTVGKAKQMEAITIALNNPPYDGNIQYRAHVQDEGWQNWRVNGTSAGTSGEARRLEAIEIKLTGEMANKYDVYYRVHCQDYGWLGWAKSGASAGSEGMSKRLEAIEIVFVEKGGKAPGSTSNAFYKK